MKCAVKLHRDDLGTVVQERQGQSAGSGPDLQDSIAGTNSGRADHEPDQVGIDHEVLAEPPSRPEAVSGEKRLQLAQRPGQGVCVIARTWTAHGVPRFVR